jgi:predicted nucleotidyltransferase component of viral defense system
LQKFNIKKWVAANPEQLSFRQAVHTVLTAISGTPDLQTSMIMKGGLLLALGYESPRFTKDIDFSTPSLLSTFDMGKFRKELDDGLINAIERLGYGLDCRIQKLEQSPPHKDATFPTIRASIGYAYKSESNAHKRLMAGHSSNVIGVDYSLNEPIGNTDFLELAEGNVIRTYDLVELIAEKFRALLQQQARNRVRRQDIYDLYYVLKTHPFIGDTLTKERILQRMVEKSTARKLSLTHESMSNPEIMRRAREQYPLLASEIEGELPSFDAVYEAVESFYRSLPWKET